jgi:hypothetical protein
VTPRRDERCASSARRAPILALDASALGLLATPPVEPGGGVEGGPDPPASFALPILFEAGAGQDSLVGPAIDVVWEISGPGAGSVGGVVFEGVESLEGAPGNADRFVLAQGWGSAARSRRRRQLDSP